MKLHKSRLAAAVAALLTAAGMTVCAAAVDLEDDETILPSDAQQEVETFTEGDYTYSILTSAEDENEQAVCIEQYDGSESAVEIPAELAGMPVVKLGDYAFTASYTLESVTLPDSLVGLGTFSFANCTNLKEYQVAEGNPYFTAEDGILFAQDGEYLMRYPIGTHPTDYVVPEKVVSIGNVAFDGSQSLESITLPDSLVYIGVSAFADCTSLREISIPEGVTEIEPYTFNGCTSLASVEMKGEVTEIGAAAFVSTALTELEIPDSCTTIGQQAYANSALTSVTIPPTVTSIGYRAFGWKLNAYDEMAVDGNFVVYGYVGTAAETYVSDEDNEGALTFESLDGTDQDEAAEGSETTAKTIEPVGDDGSGSKIVRTIGIAVCGVLLIVIIAAALLTGKKKPEEEPDEDETESA